MANFSLSLLPQNLQDKIEQDPNTNCWNWIASKNRDGYGSAIFGGRNKRCHRITFEIFKHPIANGLEIDHLCRNRKCCNPEHLEAVTHAENMKRAYKTHCRNGHELKDYNIKIDHLSGGKIARRCKICRNQKERIRARRNRSGDPTRIQRSTNQCLWCGEDITHKLESAKYCNGNHKNNYLRQKAWRTQQSTARAMVKGFA